MIKFFVANIFVGFICSIVAENVSLKKDKEVFEKVGIIAYGIGLLPIIIVSSVYHLIVGKK